MLNLLPVQPELALRRKRLRRVGLFVLLCCEIVIVLFAGLSISNARVEIKNQLQVLQQGVLSAASFQKLVDENNAVRNKILLYNRIVDINSAWLRTLVHLAWRGWVIDTLSFRQHCFYWTIPYRPADEIGFSRELQASMVRVERVGGYQFEKCIG